jgi:allantoin racemase
MPQTQRLKLAILMPVKESSIVTDYAAIEAARSPDVDFVIAGLAEGPDAIESARDEVLAAPGILKKALELEQQGCSAVVINCALDPALEAARELVSVPVIGPLQATLAVASQMGERICIIAIVAEAEPLFRRRVRDYGFEGRLAGVRHVNTHVLDIEVSRRLLRDDLSREARQAVVEERADVIVLGCTGLVGVASDVQARVGVLVLDPLLVALRTAEMFARAGLTHSRAAYPCPRK